jgi:hypothetical protein
MGSSTAEYHDRLTPRRSAALHRRHERLMRRGLFASLVLHILLFVLFSRSGDPESPFAAAGPRAGDDQAAAGGGLQAVALQVRPPAEIMRPPEPVIIPDLSLRELEPTDPLDEVDFGALDAALGQPGPTVGPGRETGQGLGDGGTADEGRFRVLPPVPRGLIIPPSDRPNSVRGRGVEVWVFVTMEGRVVADSTRLRPPTGDRGFDARLRRQAAEWVFEPARRGGQPVAEWFRYEVGL